MSKPNTQSLAHKLEQPFLREGEILIGHDDEYGRIAIPQKDLTLHTGVLGSTGTGKTVLLSSVVTQAIRNGWGVLYVDMKFDPGAYRSMVAAAKACDRLDDLRLISPVGLSDGGGLLGGLGTCSYNPLMGIQGQLALTSAILQAADKGGQTHSYWEDVKDEVVSALVGAFLSTGRAWTFRDAWMVLEKEAALTALLRESKDRAANVVLQSWLEALADPKRAAEHEKHVKGCKMFFRQFSLDAMGDMLNTTRPDISMRQLWMEQRICYTVLPAMMISHVAKSLGKLMLSELLYLAGYVQTMTEVRRPLLVIIDEFENFLFTGIDGLFNKGRSAGIMMFVAHQTLKQIDAEHGTAFRDSLMENMRNKIVLAPEGSDTAKTIADLIGTDQEKVTLRFGDVSVGEADQYRISPTALTDMEDFELVLRSKGKFQRGKLIAFPSDWEVGVDIPALRFTPTLTDEGGIGLYAREVSRGGK